MTKFLWSFLNEPFQLSADGVGAYIVEVELEEDDKTILMLRTRAWPGLEPEPELKNWRGEQLPGSWHEVPEQVLYSYIDEGL